MSALMLSKRGIGIIHLILASVIFLGVFLSVIGALARQRREMERFEELFIAELYVAELLELFRAHSSAEFLNYLSSNPIQPVGNTCILPPCDVCGVNCAVPQCASCKPYPLCSHINILDRQNGRLLNPDPIAELPDPVQKILLRPNRFFQVQVINLDTLEIDSDTFCRWDAASMPPLASNERLLVTVGLTWESRVAPGEPKRVVLSSVLPDP